VKSVGEEARKMDAAAVLEKAKGIALATGTTPGASSGRLTFTGEDGRRFVISPEALEGIEEAVLAEAVRGFFAGDGREGAII
jgi:hypothetical protein